MLILLVRTLINCISNVIHAQFMFTSQLAFWKKFSCSDYYSWGLNGPPSPGARQRNIFNVLHWGLNDLFSRDFFQVRPVPHLWGLVMRDFCRPNALLSTNSVKTLNDSIQNERLKCWPVASLVLVSMILSRQRACLVARSSYWRGSTPVNAVCFHNPCT